MTKYLAILPIALLVTYSQLAVKWRVSATGASSETDFIQKLVRFASDPIVVSAYAAALLGSFAWLYVVSKLPLTLAFPIYIGLTFTLVAAGGWLFLSESLTVMKIFSVLLIFLGIVIGILSDA